MARGERNGAAKATPRIVKEIRERYRTGLIGIRPLALEYGLGRRTVQHIVKGETWGWLE